jgi:hypothetical protein
MSSRGSPKVGCLASRLYISQSSIVSKHTFLAAAVMAINWDKLSRAQRDYPKPKFALPYIDKLLKKNPGNPYLSVSNS